MVKLSLVMTMQRKFSDTNIVNFSGVLKDSNNVSLSPLYFQNPLHMLKKDKKSSSTPDSIDTCASNPSNMKSDSQIIDPDLFLECPPYSSGAYCDATAQDTSFDDASSSQLNTSHNSNNSSRESSFDGSFGTSPPSRSNHLDNHQNYRIPVVVNSQFSFSGGAEDQHEDLRCNSPLHFADCEDTKTCSLCHGECSKMMHNSTINKNFTKDLIRQPEQNLRYKDRISRQRHHRIPKSHLSSLEPLALPLPSPPKESFLVRTRSLRAADTSGKKFSQTLLSRLSDTLLLDPGKPPIGGSRSMETLVVSH